MRTLSRGRKVALLATTAVVGGLALGVTPASAGTSTLFTITGVALGTQHLAPALTANQVITVTGTGFTEDDMSSVTIGGCIATLADPTATPAVAEDATLRPLTYIVTSPTTLVVKTSNTCKPTSGAVVTLTDSASNTAVSTPTVAAQKLDFVTPPSLAATNPVISANTSTMGVNIVKTAPVTGGTLVKVTAGADKFQNTSTYPLAASLGGIALTGITPHFVTGTSGDVDYFTGRVGAHAAGSVGLSVTSGGVTKTFASVGFSYAGTTISVLPASGPSDGGNVIKISGAGFVPSGTGASAVTICGAPASVITSGTSASSATALNVTVPAITPASDGTVDGVCSVKVTTGTLASIVNAGSTYTYVAMG